MENTIYGLSNFDYHNSAPYTEYLSSTALKNHLKSPRFFKWKLDHPDEEKSDALEFGSLFHEAMQMFAEGVTPDAFPKLFRERVAVFEPPVNEKTGQPYGTATKVYKEAYDAFLQSNNGKPIADEEDIELVHNMTLSLLCGCGATSKQVRDLLKWGKPEVSHFVEYEGRKFKYRPDLETKRKIIDWKTVSTSDLSERSINSIIAKFGYDISGAFYQFMEHERSGAWKNFYWCFVSKQPPFDAVLVDASNWTYDYDPATDVVMPQVGAIKMKRLLDLHIKCTEENEWPGAEIYIPADDFGRRIMCPTPPQWEINNASDILEQTF